MGLSPDRHQIIIWTSAGLLLIGPLGRNLSEILIEILTFSFKKMHLRVSSAKRLPFCLGLHVLKQTDAIFFHILSRLLICWTRHFKEFIETIDWLLFIYSPPIPTSRLVESVRNISLNTVGLQWPHKIFNTSIDVVYSCLSDLGHIQEARLQILWD